MVKSINDVALDYLLESNSRYMDRIMELTKENTILECENKDLTEQVIMGMPMIEYRQRAFPVS